MGVVSVNEVTWIGDADADSTGERKAVRLFNVEVVHGDRSYVALRANALPRIFASFPDDASLVAVSAKSKFKSGSTHICEVRVNYTNRPPNPDENDQDDPLNSRPREVWEAEEFDEIVEEDRNGKTILNTAGDPFDEPLMFTYTRPVLVVTRNESSYDSVAAFRYNNSVSSDVFRGAAIGTLRVQVVGTPEYQNGLEFWKVVYRFRYNPRGWQPKPLNHGLYQKVVASSAIIGGVTINTYAKVPCTEKGGATDDSDFATIPMPLDADGAQIPVEDLPDAAHYLEDIEVLEPLSYVALGL